MRKYISTHTNESNIFAEVYEMLTILLYEEQNEQPELEWVVFAIDSYISCNCEIS